MVSFWLFHQQASIVGLNESVNSADARNPQAPRHTSQSQVHLRNLIIPSEIGTHASDGKCRTCIVDHGNLCKKSCWAQLHFVEPIISHSMLLCYPLRLPEPALQKLRVRRKGHGRRYLVETMNRKEVDSATAASNRNRKPSRARHA